MNELAYHLLTYFTSWDSCSQTQIHFSSGGLYVEESRKCYLKMIHVHLKTYSIILLKYCRMFDNNTQTEI